MGRVREDKRRQEKKKEDQKEKVSEERKDPGARKGRKVAKNCVFSNGLWLRRVEK